LVLLASGVGILLTAVVVPLVVCRSDYSTDPSGRRVDTNPCRDIGDGVKVAWIGGAGIGLTAAILGGITFASAGPKLRLSAGGAGHWLGATFTGTF
jgi:hypothetical protein